MGKTWGRLLRTLTLLLAAATGSASADTVSYTARYDGPTDVTNLALSLNRFDPGMGTLQSALFTLSARLEISAFAMNDGNFMVTWDVLSQSFNLTGSGDLQDLAIAGSNAPVRVLGSGSAGDAYSFFGMARIGSNSADQHYVGQGVTAFGLPVSFYQWEFAGPTLTASQAFTLDADARFIGDGTLDFLLSTNDRIMLALGGTQTLGQPSPAWSGTRADVLATVTVTYDYLPAIAADAGGDVPEPAPYALLAASLAPLAARRRRQAAGAR